MWVTASVTTMQLCHCGTNAITDNTETKGHGYASLKLYKQKEFQENGEAGNKRNVSSYLHNKYNARIRHYF